MITSKRKWADIQMTQLVNERQSHEDHWKELSNSLLPRRSRWQVQDNNRGDRRNTKIIDGTATLAARTFASGMMAGITSPARPWFRLTTPDLALAELEAVKWWLHTVTQRMQTVFLRSNLYQILPTQYKDLGTFGIAPVMAEEDFDTVIHFTGFPIGSYYVSVDRRNRVRVFARKYRVTVRELLEEFAELPNGDIDWSRVSSATKAKHDQHLLEDWVWLSQIIAPNPDHDPRNPLSKYKKFMSLTWEMAAQDEAGKEVFLRESGYDYFPVLCPRWEVSAGDIYPTDCPGMTALGDVKQLQHHEKRKAQAIDKMVDPPMQGPSNMRGGRNSILSGDMTYIDVREGQAGFRPTHEVKPQIEDQEYSSEQIRERINKAYYVHLFQMLTNLKRREITAREIEERHEEKLLELGPVLEQLNQAQLDPLIDITFQFMVRQGMIPPAPEELQGQPLRVEYISIMAQAQKLVGRAGMDQLLYMVGQLATLVPQVMDKIDADQFVDEYAEMMGIPPRCVVPDNRVVEIREARAQLQAQTAAMEQAAQGAKAAKDLAAAKLSEDSLMRRLTEAAEAGQLVSA